MQLTEAAASVFSTDPTQILVLISSGAVNHGYLVVEMITDQGVKHLSTQGGVLSVGAWEQVKAQVNSIKG